MKIWFWICGAFGWFFIFPRDVKYLLSILLLYHPFKSAKALMQMHLTHTFFRVLWKERNQRTFFDKEHPFMWPLIFSFTVLFLEVKETLKFLKQRHIYLCIGRIAQLSGSFYISWIFAAHNSKNYHFFSKLRNNYINHD